MIAEADAANSVALLAFVLTALVVSRLSARVTEHAKESESRAGRCTICTSLRGARCR